MHRGDVALYATVLAKVKQKEYNNHFNQPKQPQKNY